jgi:hypothetical protein
MSKRFAITTGAAFLVLGTAAAFAGELPGYAIGGLPATPHQMAVLGLSGGTQEIPAAPMLTFGGMPASPLQIAVLNPRPRISLSQVESAARPQ